VNHRGHCHWSHWLLDHLWLGNDSLLDHLWLASGHLLDQNWLLLLDLRVHGQRRLEHWELKTGHDRLVDLWLGGDRSGDDSSGSDDLVSHWVLLGLEVLVDDVLDVIGVDDVHDRRSSISAHPCKGLTLVDHVDTSLSDDRAGSVSGTWGSVVKLAWLLDLLNILSAVVSSESESLVLGVGSSAASSPAGPVPLAAITHIAGNGFISKDLAVITDAESSSDGTTVAVSSSGLLSQSAGDSACRPRRPGSEVRADERWAGNDLGLVVELAVESLSGASPRSCSRSGWSDGFLAAGSALGVGGPRSPSSGSTARTGLLGDLIAGASVFLGDGSDARAGHWVWGRASVGNDNPTASLARAVATFSSAVDRDSVAIAVFAEGLDVSSFSAANAGDVAGLGTSAEGRPLSSNLFPRSKINHSGLNLSELSGGKLRKGESSRVDSLGGSVGTAWDLVGRLSNASNSWLTVSIEALSSDNGGAWVGARALGVDDPSLPAGARWDVAKLLSDFDVAAFIESLRSLDFSGVSGIDALLGASGEWSPLSWGSCWNVTVLVDGLVSEHWVDSGEISTFVLDDKLLETSSASSSGHANGSHATTDGSSGCDWSSGLVADRWLAEHGDGVVVGIALASVGQDRAVGSLDASVARAWCSAAGFDKLSGVFVAGNSVGFDLVHVAKVVSSSGLFTATA